MICRSCGTQNLPTSLRCIQCGTTLVKEAFESTEAYRAGARAIDARMFGGVGSVVGFALTYFVLKFVLENMYFDAREIYGGAFAGSIVGAITGRLIAYKKWR